MHRYTTLKAIACIVTGVFSALLFNYYVAEPFLISDECHYHGNDTTAIFNLFYSLPAFNGGHPYPTMLNFLATMVAGGVLGYMAGKKLFHKKAAA